MIYTARPAALSKPVAWRLDDGVLVENARRYDLADLRGARLVRGKGGARILMLQIGHRRLAIPSHSQVGFAGRADQGEAFRPFVRALLAQAASRAPKAAYRLAGGLDLSAYGAALAILGVGIILVFVATLAAGQFVLGLDLGSRLIFALLLLLTPLPWLQPHLQRRFDPRAVPDAALV